MGATERAARARPERPRAPRRAPRAPPREPLRRALPRPVQLRQARASAAGASGAGAAGAGAAVRPSPSRPRARATRRTIVVAAVASATATARAVRAWSERERRRRVDHRSARVHLVDPEAKDAVGDLQVVVEVVEDALAVLEAEEAVVRLVSLIDLVRHLAGAPRALLLERRALLDPAACADRDLVTALIGHLGIEHQNEFVFGS